MKYKFPKGCQLGRKFYHTNDFFTNPSLVNSYWAGFIAADGYILTSRPTLGITQSIKDLGHLEKFKKDIKFTGEVKIYTSSGFENSKDYGRILINSKKIVKDLKRNYSVVPRKSLILKPPKNLSYKQSLAFIAGYIDGDGCVYLQDKEYPIIEILGTKALLKWILKVLKKYNFNTQISQAKKTTTVNRLKLCSTGKVINLYKEIKLLNLPLMDRKWSRIDINKVSLRSRW